MDFTITYIIRPSRSCGIPFFSLSRVIECEKKKSVNFMVCLGLYIHKSELFPSLCIQVASNYKQLYRAISAKKRRSSPLVTHFPLQKAKRGARFSLYIAAERICMRISPSCKFYFSRCSPSLSNFLLYSSRARPAGFGG